MYPGRRVPSFITLEAIMHSRGFSAALSAIDAPT
jgi:hypothetical protein